MRDPRPDTRLQERSNDPHPWGGIITVGAVLVILMVGGVALYVKSRSLAVVTDAETLCPTDRPPSEVVVVLLDVSDEFSEPQTLQVRNHLERVRDSIPRFGLVQVYAVDRVGQRLSKAVIHLCNPGTGADLSRIYQNPQLARGRWRLFADTVSKEVNRQLSLPDASASPIFEAIQATALRTFGRPEYDGIPKRLVIVSDLLQNMPGELSMYAGLPAFSSFKSSPYFLRVRSDLTDISVIVYYLVRSNVATQGRAHVTFWEEYFRSQGAVLESVTSVFGDR